MGPSVLSGIFSLFLAVGLARSQLISDELRLMRNLTSHYSKDVRPVLNPSQAVNVTLGFSLQQIYHLDEEKHALHSMVWLNMVWDDVSFRWDPADYGGLETIRISSEKVWKPDIIMYNSISDTWQFVDTLPVISYDGSVSWISPIHLHSSCFLDLTRFPFDTQTCGLKFGSWTYGQDKVNLLLGMVDTTGFVAHNEWDLIETPVNRRVFSYECCPESYVDIKLTLKMKRRTFRYAKTIMLPSIVLALTIPFVFLVAPGSPEKTTLGTGVLMGLVLLAILMRDMMPPGAHTVAALTLYNVSCIALTGFSLMFGSIVNTVWYKTGDVPEIVRKIFLSGLGRILCVSLKTYYKMPFEPSNVENDAKDDAGCTSGRSRGEWQLLAMVIDRLLLLIFLLAAIITTIAILS